MNTATAPRQIRVLLLEDDNDDLFATKRMLAADRTPGFAVTHAGSVAEAEVRLRNELPDIVLTDLCVPDSKGLPTFKALHRAAPGVPVVVLSGIVDEQTALAAVRAGAQDYLIKSTVQATLLTRTLHHAIERHRADVALRESEQRFLLAVNGAKDGLWDWRLDGGLYLSPRWRAMLGYAEDAHPASPEAWLAALHPDDVDAFTTALDDHLAGRTAHFEREHRIRDGHGQWRWVLTRGLAIRDDQGKAWRIAGSQSDISARKQAEDRLRYEALHDSLTGLPNRALCLDRIGHAIARAHRDPLSRFAVLFLDLDRFKVVNDNLGHVAGDRLLSAFARRCSRLVRPGDTFARLGGDEFCIVLDSVASPQEAEHVALRVQRALRAPFDLDGREVLITASLGVCLNTPEHTTADGMLRDADVAMYRAKASGRGCHILYESSLDHGTAERLDIEMDLRRALERDEFVLYFQPIVSLADRRITGAEALLRWQSPTRGMVGPNEFIPLAEDTGLIVPIGRWVIETAARTAALWHAEASTGACGRKVPTVSVNLSPRQFRDIGLVEYIRDVLRDSGLPPAGLVLEITESVLMDHTEDAIAILGELRELGVGIHLDDFGTGFSSLRYLQRLPIDRLKIDRSFVRGIPDRKQDADIVRTIIELGHQLGKTVVAEGIETEAQHNALLQMGCGFAQGFLYGRPAAAMPALQLAA